MNFSNLLQTVFMVTILIVGGGVIAAIIMGLNATAWQRLKEEHPSVRYTCYEWAFNSRWSPFYWINRFGFKTEKEEVQTWTDPANISLIIRFFIWLILMSICSIGVWICIWIDEIRSMINNRISRKVINIS